MSLKNDLASDVSNILTREWNIRDGQVIPFTENVTLAGGAVRLQATILYADLADSTELAMNYDRRVAAKVFKGFLTCSSKLIRARGGEIRSFDGDRVMGIFVGDSKNTMAVKCALNINYAFLEIIKPKLEAKYPSLVTGSYELAHCVGVDTSEMLIVRGGVRDNNDLVWIGRAPNVAAKLSSVRDSPYHSYITAAVYNGMHDSSKYAAGESMWQRDTWSEVDGISVVYKSSWQWEP